MAAKFTFMWTRKKKTIKIHIYPLFSMCCSKLRNFFILYDLGAEENINVYCSSSDL